MSNKKRIGKKMACINKKTVKNKMSRKKLIHLMLDKIQESHITLESSLNDFIQKLACYPPEIFDDPYGTKGVYEIKYSGYHTYGYSFEENFDTDFVDFVFEIRKLTPLDEISCKNLCRKVPSNLRNDFKNLVIVGFEAYEAFALLRDTYKF